MRNGVAELSCRDGRMSAPTSPGLGVDVGLDSLGAPLIVVDVHGVTRGTLD